MKKIMILGFALVLSLILLINFSFALTNVSNCTGLQRALINSDDDITLTNDIDCKNVVWQDWDTITPPITIEAASYTRQYTNHIFDGQGHIISNLYINTSTSTTNYNGLIPYATNVIIKDVLFRNEQEPRPL